MNLLKELYELGLKDIETLKKKKKKGSLSTLPSKIGQKYWPIEI